MIDSADLRLDGPNGSWAELAALVNHDGVLAFGDALDAVPSGLEGGCAIWRIDPASLEAGVFLEARSDDQSPSQVLRIAEVSAGLIVQPLDRPKGGTFSLSIHFPSGGRRSLPAEPATLELEGSRIDLRRETRLFRGPWLRIADAEWGPIPVELRAGRVSRSNIAAGAGIDQTGWFASLEEASELLVQTYVWRSLPHLFAWPDGEG